MLLRPYQVSDAESLVAIFQDAVTGIGASAYDARQIAVWSSYPEDLEEFRQLLACGLTLVAEENKQAVAFGQLNPLNHIAFLYTATNFARLGYGTAIYQQLEVHARDHGMKRLHTEASRISKHLFLKMGFHIVEREIAIRHGVEFERFKMEKVINNY
jgi:putative acetyltransferase